MATLERLPHAHAVHTYNGNSCQVLFQDLRFFSDVPYTSYLACARAPVPRTLASYLVCDPAFPHPNM